MNLKRLATVTSATMGAIATLILLWLLGSSRTLATTALSIPGAGAATESPLHYVAITGTDSGDCSTPVSACLTIQYALDQAGEGDEIRIASGVYTDVQGRPAPPGYAYPPTSGLITQVVYISKSITIRGGYTTAFSEPPSPEANPTTLDAQGRGRVLCITGEVSPTVEGLRITGGDAEGLDGFWGKDAGGGVYVLAATAIIHNNQVFSNTADIGGGLHLIDSTATVSGNTIRDNTASLAGGGGLYLHRSAATVSGNTVASNAASDGGGLLAANSDATISGNLIISNTVSTSGGGLFLNTSNATISGNLIMSNSASYRGGGLDLSGHSDATVINNVIADNQTDFMASGVHIGYSSPCLLHNTIARNLGGDGWGVYINKWESNYSTVAMTNTILVSQNIGIYIHPGNTATLEATLWGDGAWANGVDWGGDGRIITGTVNIWDDPVFVDPDAGNYHIGLASAAIDKGVDAGVDNDIDGDPRPQGSGYDIGADETGLAVTKRADPDTVISGGQITYTILVTNTSNADLRTVILDTLPAHATPGGVIIAWTPSTITSRGVWTEQFTVTVDLDYTGPLTNVVQAFAFEGPAGTDSVTVTAIYHRIYLPLVLR